MQMGEPYLGSRPEPMSFDTESVRSDFPLIVDSNLVYLDNAATTQKPRVVLDALRTYYETYNANVHRAAHNPHCLEPFEWWDRLALVEFDSRPVDTITCEEVPQLCRMFAVDVLQHQKAHIEPLCRRQWVRAQSDRWRG